jgi:hypothetical protein
MPLDRCIAFMVYVPESKNLWTVRIFDVDANDSETRIWYDGLAPYASYVSSVHKRLLINEGF